MCDNITGEFLTYLHRGGAWSYWWSDADKRSRWWPVGKPLPLPAGKMNVYYGVHPLAARKSDHERAKNQDVCVTNCLFADFDAKAFGNDKERALAHLQGLTVPGSVIIDSGGGFHAYWLLRDTMLLTEKADRERAQRVQAGWVRYVGADPAAKDLARVLRVPGTRNYKPNYAPDFPLVSFVEVDLTRTYDLADLEQQLPMADCPRPTVIAAQPLGTVHEGAKRYAQAALDGEIGTLTQTPEGGRNDQLNRSAFKIGQLIEAGNLSRYEVEDALFGAACQIGLDGDPNCGEAGIRKTIESGLEDGMAQPRMIREPTRRQARGYSQVMGQTLPPMDSAADQAASEADLINRLETLCLPDGKPDRREVEKATMSMVPNLARLNDLQFLNVLSFLANLGITQSFIKDLKNIVKKERAKFTASTESGTDKERPWPYAAWGGQMFYLTERTGENGEIDIEEHVIADFEARITQQVVNEEGEAIYTIAGHTPDAKAFSLEISVADFTDSRRLLAALTQAAGPTARVVVGMERHLRTAIQSLSDVSVPQVRRYRRTGWVDDNKTFLLPGREPPGVTLSLPRKLPYAIMPDSDLHLGLEALVALLESMPIPRSTVAVAALLEAPLARLADWQGERYALFIAGRSGSLKTTWIQTAMALYGPDFLDDGLVLKWGEGATRNAIMAYATYARDLPLLIDNFKPNTGGGTRDFTNLIHNILEGGEKDRLNRHAELRETKPVFCWPVFTGEDVPDDDPASLARVLVVPFEWPQGEANELLAKARRLAPHLSAVGGSWIDWLASAAGQQAATAAAQLFENTRAKWLRRLRTVRKDMVNSLRVASNLATNQLTWWVMQQHPDIGPIIQNYTAQHDAGLSEIAEQMAGRTAEALEATRFVKTLRELLASGRAVLLSKGATAEGHGEPPERMLGWQGPGDEGVYILPTIAYQMVEKLLGPGGLGGISSKTLYAQLASLQCIGRHDAGGHLYSLRTPAGTKKVLHLQADILFPSQDEVGLEADDV